MTSKHFIRTLGVLAALLLAAACTGTSTNTTGSATLAAEPYAADLQGAVISPPRTITGFDIPSTMGTNFNLTDYTGKVVLIYFGYRSCPDFCPTTLAEMTRIFAELGDQAANVKVVFTTVDPERDDLDNLTLYMSNFNSEFIAVRTEGQTLQNLMNQFGVTATRRQVGDSAMAYLVDHTATVFLIGPDSRLQAQYLYGTDYHILLHDIRLILNQT